MKISNRGSVYILFILNSNHLSLGIGGFSVFKGFDLSGDSEIRVIAKEFIMKQNLKKMISYYKPYMGTFYLDMFFALLASLISLVIPLVVRYVTDS